MGVHGRMVSTASNYLHSLAFQNHLPMDFPSCLEQVASVGSRLVHWKTTAQLDQGFVKLFI